MSHARQTIREAVATILRTTPTLWLTTMVKETRIQSDRQQWPYLMVFAESESSGQISVNKPSVYERTLTISVVALLRLPGSGDTITIEDKLDAISAEIETKLTFATLVAVVSAVKNIQHTATAMDVIIEEDGIDHAELNLTFLVTYYTQEGLPSAFL